APHDQRLRLLRLQPLQLRTELVGEDVEVLDSGWRQSRLGRGVGELGLHTRADRRVEQQADALVATVMGQVLAEHLYLQGLWHVDLEHRALGYGRVEVVARPRVLEHRDRRHLIALDQVAALVETEPATPQHAGDVWVTSELLVRLDALRRLLARVARDDLELATADAPRGVDLLNGCVQRILGDRADEAADARIRRDGADLDRVARTRPLRRRPRAARARGQHRRGGRANAGDHSPPQDLPAGDLGRHGPKGTALCWIEPLCGVEEDGKGLRRPEHQAVDVGIVRFGIKAQIRKAIEEPVEGDAGLHAGQVHPQ